MHHFTSARLFMALLFCLSFVGCGDDSGPAPADSGTVDSGAVDSGAVDSGTVDSGAVDSGAVDSGGGAGPCPATAPMEGGACDREGLACEYGTDPRPRCRTVATCTSGAWSIPLTGCPPPPATMCPATREAAAGADCSPEDAYCDYDGLACHCTNCNDGPVVMCGGPTTWHCDAPNADPQCPAAMPRLGSVCAMDGQMCSYGCEDGMARTCSGGVWTRSTAPGGCPVSTRRAKRDIHYLSPAEAEAISEQVQRTRLATWEYRDPALRGRRHLGFILEDQPGSYAEDPEARMVDLYGYTSMLLATTQAQQREIESLRRELDALRRRLPAPTPR